MITFEDEKRIEELYKSSAEALAGGNLDALSFYYIEEAIQFPPDAAPIVGWSAIRKSLENELDGITFVSAMEVSEVVVAGDLAHAWGSYQATVAPKTGGDSTMTSGSFLDILARQADGSWRISRSTWSNHKLGN